MDISIVKLGNKGRVVIPMNMRQDIKKGDSLMVIRDGRQIIFRKASDLNSMIVSGMKKKTTKK